MFACVNMTWECDSHYSISPPDQKKVCRGVHAAACAFHDMLSLSMQETAAILQEWQQAASAKHAG